MRGLAARPALVWYYLATPVFALLDLGLGLPFRVAGLVDPVHRAGYYLAVTALAVLVGARPRLAPWVGMGESAVNLGLLLLSILLPIWSLPDQILAGGGTEGLPGTAALLNVLLVGTALVVAFHRHQARALSPRSRTEV